MPYPGGKAGAGTYQKIINQIPPHDVFIEAFFGDGAITRFKRPAARTIAIEIDPDVARNIAGRSAEAALFAGPAGDFELHNCNAIEWLKHRFDLYRLPTSTAAQSNGSARVTRGNNQSPIGHAAGSAAGRSTGPSSLKQFVYLDPPYLLSTRRSPRPLYRFEMTDAQHAELLDAATRLPCDVAISGYWSPLYAAALQTWRYISFTSATRGGRPAREFLWLNYPAPAELHDYRYLGNEKRERERITRKVRTWSAGLQRLPHLERQAILAALPGNRR